VGVRDRRKPAVLFIWRLLFSQEASKTIKRLFTSWQAVRGTSLGRERLLGGP